MTLNGFINTITKEIMTKPCTQYSSHHEIPIIIERINSFLLDNLHKKVLFEA